MPFLLESAFHQSLAEAVYNDFLANRSTYYYFIGKIIDWEDELNPDTPQDTSEYERLTRNNIITVKKINIRDVSLVTRRIDWTSGTVYDQYDGNYTPSYPAASGATSLKDANFYVLTSEFNVYKCLFNNNGTPSTDEPTGVDTTPILMSDGYVWKYLYTVTLATRNKFLTPDFMPVQRSVTNAFYSNGEISSVVIDSNGSGYLGNANVTLTVNGTFLGGNGNVVANLTPVFNTAGEFVDIRIDNPGNNYKTASITINEYTYTGRSKYKGLANVRIFNPGTGYTPAVVNNTTATLSTTGVFQPTSNAFVSLIYSSNSVVDIVIANPGTGYTTEAQANTTLTISTSGNSQPTANATANLFFANSAILTPIIFDNKLKDVVIVDPGTGYESNLQTYVTLFGDGEGAVLTPFINSAGQVEDIIINERGQGYTYADINIVSSTGTNANAYVNLSLSDLETLQTVVELAAVNGAIHALRINDGGQDYSYANVVITGNGVNFNGNVVLVDNSISYIQVITPGQNYTYGNVSIMGDGSNANVTAIFSPAGGHGSDVVTELFADTIMFTSSINNERNHGFEINNDYRQFGIIKNLKAFNSPRTYNSVLGTGTYLLTLSSVLGLTNDQILELYDGSLTKLFQVVRVLPDTTQVILQNMNEHELEVEDVLVDPDTSIPYTVTAVDGIPDINKFSGQLLYTDNRTTVSYSDQQLVTLRTVIRL
jgi:hypothetical protein